jgi:hypothetical protein
VPSKSKAQQKLFQAAEHGANFPMARKIRASMTHQQMHDFAAGSMAGKPAHVKPLHPALAAHGQKVKAAHAHLSKHSPSFKSMPAAHRMRAVQAHIRRTK